MAITLSAVDSVMKAWELLSDPTRWTQHTTARNKFGGSVCSTDSDATCWCTFGAMRKVYDADIEAYRKAEQKLADAVFPESIPTWNDSSDHATVLAKLKQLDI